MADLSKLQINNSTYNLKDSRVEGKITDYYPILMAGGSNVSNRGINVVSNTGRYMQLGNLIYFTVFFRLEAPGNFNNTSGGLEVTLPVGKSKNPIPVQVGLHSSNVSNAEAAMVWGNANVATLMTAGGLNATLVQNTYAGATTGYISITGWYELA